MSEVRTLPRERHRSVWRRERGSADVAVGLPAPEPGSVAEVRRHRRPDRADVATSGVGWDPWRSPGLRGRPRVRRRAHHRRGARPPDRHLEALRLRPPQGRRAPRPDPVERAARRRRGHPLGRRPARRRAVEDRGPVERREARTPQLTAGRAPRPRGASAVHPARDPPRLPAHGRSAHEPCRRRGRRCHRGGRARVRPRGRRDQPGSRCGDGPVEAAILRLEALTAAWRALDATTELQAADLAAEQVRRDQEARANSARLRARLGDRSDQIGGTTRGDGADGMG
jgi:hypothetical protein